MRATVCELPHLPNELDGTWPALCDHVQAQRSELLLLPEFAFVEPVWQAERFDEKRWAGIVALSDSWLARLPELNIDRVVGARPVTVDGIRYNEGFIWTREGGCLPLRRKYLLPNEPGGWEAQWFTRGDPNFFSFNAGNLVFGLNICTELWALESYSSYASDGVDAILSPRATAANTAHKWLSVGVVAAIRSGAYCLSSNRIHTDGSCGGIGWIIGPDGEILAETSERTPFRTMSIDLAVSARARHTYPRYVLNEAAPV